MKDRNHLIVEFSEGIDSTKLSKDNFYLLDSVNNRKITPDYFYKGEVKANQFSLAFKDTSSFKEYLLVANNFADINGNKIASDIIPLYIKPRRILSRTNPQRLPVILLMKRWILKNHL